MIEVEKKFLLDEGDKARLVMGADFLGRKVITDLIYDAPDYHVTCSDMILRSRDGNFELKVPVHEDHNAQTRLVDQYRELETDDEIRQYLKIPGQGTLAHDLMCCGYAPFVTLVTVREKYHYSEFQIDIDEVDFGFNVVEIEMMVAETSEVRDALQKIVAFASSRGLSRTPHGGKIMEYIRRHRPDHYAALVRAGIAGSG